MFSRRALLGTRGPGRAGSVEGAVRPATSVGRPLVCGAVPWACPTVDRWACSLEAGSEQLDPASWRKLWTEAGSWVRVLP